MLVLSRRQAEEIVFPQLDIVVHVLRIRGKSVSLGVEAPSKIRVRRGELPQLAVRSAGCRSPGREKQSYGAASQSPSSPTRPSGGGTPRLRITEPLGRSAPGPVRSCETAR